MATLPTMAMAPPLFQFPRRRRRACIARASGSDGERRELKDALAERLEETAGNLDDQAMSLISSLEQLNRVTDLASATNLYKGAFVGLRASFKNTGRRGESQKEVGFSGALVTLGRATFNVFKPPSLDIRLGETYNHVGLERDGEYTLIIRFQVPASAGDEQDELPGLLINRATFSISGPKRMDVLFSSSTMRPQHPDRDLARWLAVFKPENPAMDESTGIALSNLPPAKGWLDYLYLDDELRITRGNRGGVSVVRRLAAPVVATAP